MLLAALELIRALRLAVSPFDDVTRNITKPKISTPAKTYVIGFVRRNDLCGAMLCACEGSEGEVTPRLKEVPCRVSAQGRERGQIQAVKSVLIDGIARIACYTRFLSRHSHQP
jgi:hypothetical protein